MILRRFCCDFAATLQRLCCDFATSPLPPTQRPHPLPQANQKPNQTRMRSSRASSTDPKFEPEHFVLLCESPIIAVERHRAEADCRLVPPAAKCGIESSRCCGGLTCTNEIVVNRYALFRSADGGQSINDPLLGGLEANYLLALHAHGTPNRRLIVAGLSSFMMIILIIIVGRFLCPYQL